MDESVSSFPSENTATLRGDSMGVPVVCLEGCRARNSPPIVYDLLPCCGSVARRPHNFLLIAHLLRTDVDGELLRAGCTERTGDGCESKDCALWGVDDPDCHARNTSPLLARSVTESRQSFRDLICLSEQNRFLS